MTDDKLFFSTDSWHFRYYMFIRKHWAGSTTLPTRRDGTCGTSLCPYWQTIIWGSIASLVVLPLVIIGWIETNLAAALVRSQKRWRKGKQTNPSKITDFINSLETAPDDLRGGYFIVGSFMVGLLSILAFTMITFFAWISIHGIMSIFGLIPQIPGATVDLTLLFGWVIFRGLAGLGYGMDYGAYGISCVAQSVAWYFTTPEILLATLKWGGAVAGCLASSVLVGFVGLKVYESKIFVGSRKVIARVKENSVDDSLSDPTSWGDSRPIFPPALTKWWGKMWETDVRVGEHVGKLVGPFALIGRIIWAKKRKICPMVEFVGAEDYIPKKPRIGHCPKEDCPGVLDTGVCTHCAKEFFA